MGDPEKKARIYEQFARISKALASPRRIEVLDLLCQGERNVEQVARETGLSFANASQHLQVLRGARLVEARRDDRHVYYSLADLMVCDFLRTMKGLAQHRLAEVDDVVRDYLGAGADMVPIERDDLRRRMAEGEVTLLDVRPPEEYAAGHLPDAVSVPLEALPGLLAMLPSEKTVVAYCRGPYCVFAIEAVELLRAHGFDALRLEDGVHEWRAAGHAIARGTPAAS